MRKLLLVSTTAAIALVASGLAQAQTLDTKRAAGFGTTAVGEKFALTDEQRVVMRRYVQPRTGFGVTTGSASGTTVAPGDRIPDAVELRSFPAAVYREAPGLGAYRYIRVGGQAYVVDPRDRTIIEEID